MENLVSNARSNFDGFGRNNGKRMEVSEFRSQLYVFFLTPET